MNKLDTTASIFSPQMLACFNSGSHVLLSKTNTISSVNYIFCFEVEALKKHNLWLEKTLCGSNEAEFGVILAYVYLFKHI